MILPIITFIMTFAFVAFVHKNWVNSSPIERKILRKCLLKGGFYALTTFIILFVLVALF